MATGVRIDLTDPDLFAGGPPHDAYRHLRDEAPVFWHEPTPSTPGGEGFWCLTRHEDVSWAARRPDLFSSVSGGGRDGGGTLIEDLPTGFAAGVLFNMQDDPRHRHIRRLVTPSVSPRRLRQIQTDLAERCAVLLDEALERDPCDFLVDVAAELPLQAIAALLGVPQEDRHFLLDWADATLDYDDHNPGETSTRAQEAGAAMSAYCTRLLEEKRSCPADDILSVIATARLPDGAAPSGPLTEPRAADVLPPPRGRGQRDHPQFHHRGVAGRHGPTGRRGRTCVRTGRCCPARSRRCCAGRRRPSTTAGRPPGPSSGTGS